jgi:hypothetical protein
MMRLNNETAPASAARSRYRRSCFLAFPVKTPPQNPRDGYECERHREPFLEIHFTTPKPNRVRCNNSLVAKNCEQGLKLGFSSQMTTLARVFLKGGESV